MKHSALILSLGIVAFMLSGCGKVDAYLQNRFLEDSGILEDQDYQQYSEMKQNNQLGEEGEFDDADIFSKSADTDARAGTIHVTFGENRYLEIRYYSDSSLTERIDTTQCYLNPGDAIYASVESKNPYSNLYELSAYRIYEYKGENTIKNKTTHTVEDEDNLVYQIPTTFTGSEISIVPIGTYPDRQLKMRVYYINDSQQEMELTKAGTWIINDENCTGNSASISSIMPYTLKYDFDEENYFFISASPKCFTADPNQAGFVEFWEANPTEADKEYSVELRPYLKITVSLSEGGKITLNNGNAETIKKNKNWRCEKLKYGDVIVVESAGKCAISAGDYKHVKFDRDPIASGYRYTLKIVPEVTDASSTYVEIDECVTLTLPETAAHGTCKYKLDGKTVSGKVTVQESQKLTVTYTITDSAYEFDDANVWNRVRGLVGNMEKTETIKVDSSMNNTTIDPDALFCISEKEE